MYAVFSPKRKLDPGIVLVTENDYFDVLMPLLEQAVRTIDVMAFSFVTGGENGVMYYQSKPFAILQKLKELKKRHGKQIRIRVFLEGHRDTAVKNGITAKHLSKAGIEVHLGGTHAKCFCVDGRYTLLGSTNLTDQSLNRNFETNLLLDSPRIAKQFGRYFGHYWQGGEHGDIVLKAPLIADGGFKAAVLKAIRGSKKTIHFSIYFFEQKEIEKALIAAHQRGVKISGLVHTHTRFGLDDVRRTRLTVGRLRAAGITSMSFSSSAVFTHSKYIVFDGAALLLGSGNWLDRDVTTHPQLYVQMKNPPLCRALTKHLAGILKKRL